MTLQMKKSRQSKKPAKHTKQSFYDQQAINVVSAWLAETQRAMPDLKANDKWPNIDGYIEITDENGFPKGTLKAQVKKLSVKNAQNKQHSFKDDKFFTYCKESLDWIPILLIGVDLKKKKAFWLHMDHDFLDNNGNNKTVKFIENQVIASGKTDFIHDWENIVALYDSKAKEFEKYKKAFSILSDVITPALGKTDEKFIKIHYFLDEINDYLDHKFTIVKQIFYPNTWKLGFAYYQYEKSELTYTLYPIAQSRNDVQIKEVDKNLHDIIQKEGLGFVTHFSNNPLETRPKEYAKKIIETKTLKIIEAKLLKHAGSKFLAREFIFAFIDKFHTQMGLEQKDKYSVEEIEKAFYIYLPLWLKISHDILLSQNRNNFKNRVTAGRIRYYDPDRICEIKEDEQKEIEQNVEKALKENAPAPKIPMGNEQIPFGLFVEFFNFLKQANKEIERPYKAKDFSRLKDNGSWVWSVFSKQDTAHNLKIFFESLVEVYNSILQNNFPLLLNELSLFGEADTILASWHVKDNYKSFQDGPTYELYYLKSKAKKEKSNIYLLTDEEARNLKQYDLRTRELNFRNEDYQMISRRSSVLDFIYEDTPMLNFIYKELEDQMKKYFKE